MGRMNTAASSPNPAAPARGPWEVFAVFLRLGLTSFGGPVAHLGYFHNEFVVRRRWLKENTYADLVALCQFLPGPASSQVGMAVGLQRAGLSGMLLAWVGFTLPSALLLFGFALGAPWLSDTLGTGWISGLKAAAVAVVAHAVISMARMLTPDARRATLAVATMAVVLLLPGPLTQVLAMLGAALIGLLWLPVPEAAGQQEAQLKPKVARALSVTCLVLFVLLLALLPVLRTLSPTAVVALTDVFYRTGALVFGGGHVVLPLLESEMVGNGLVDQEVFLAGYGAAQAVPGPLFTFSSFLGASAQLPLASWAGALIALVAIFLPSALLVIGVLPFWEGLRHNAIVRRALGGVNAAVVGLLAAALYSPVFTHGVPNIATFVVAALAFVALSGWKAPAWAVALGAAVLGGFLL